MNLKRLFKLVEKRKSQCPTISAWYWTFRSVSRPNVRIQVTTYHFDLEFEAWEELERSITGRYETEDYRGT